MQSMTRAQDKIGKFDTLITLGDGRVAGVEKRRLYETPFFLLTDPPFNNVAVPANLSSAEAAMRVSGEGPVQLTQIGSVRGLGHNAILVRLYMRDGSQSIQLSNVPLHIDTMTGPGGQMYPLPEGLYVDEDRAMSVVFQDISGEDTSGRICAVGAKYSQLQNDPSLKRVKERLESSQFLSAPQFYGVNDGKIILPALGQATYQVEINGAHNFELHQLSLVSTSTFSLNIVDMAKRESLINAPRNGTYRLPSTLFVGDGSYPYRFHEPPLFFGGQRILIDVEDTSGAENTIYLTLGGVALKVRKWS